MLSTKPDKAVGEDTRWEFATESLRSTLINRGINYELDEGGGAFYGPKIDIHIRDAIGRQWQITTVQFDFNLPERFGLKYIGADGQEHQPYMVHRALLGTMERFMGVLIEHYAGAFPVWLAPVQAEVIPIAERHTAYAKEIETTLLKANIRSHTSDNNDRMNAKIRYAQLQKIPYMLVIGDREQDSDTVSVRLRSGEDLGALAISDVIERISNESTTKS